MRQPNSARDSASTTLWAADAGAARDLELTGLSSVAAGPARRYIVGTLPFLIGSSLSGGRTFKLRRRRHVRLIDCCSITVRL
jgi:hypothetical protein